MLNIILIGFCTRGNPVSSSWNKIFNSEILKKLLAGNEKLTRYFYVEKLELLFSVTSAHSGPEN